MLSPLGLEDMLNYLLHDFQEATILRFTIPLGDRSVDHLLRCGGDQMEPRSFAALTPSTVVHAMNPSRCTCSCSSKGSSFEARFAGALRSRMPGARKYLRTVFRDTPSVLPISRIDAPSPRNSYNVFKFPPLSVVCGHLHSLDRDGRCLAGGWVSSCPALLGQFAAGRYTVNVCVTRSPAADARLSRPSRVYFA